MEARHGPGRSEETEMRRFIQFLRYDLDAARQMLEEGIIDVNIIDVNLRETPLHFAIKQNDLQTVQLLLEHGAQLNRKFGWFFFPAYYLQLFVCSRKLGLIMIY